MKKCVSFFILLFILLSHPFSAFAAAPSVNAAGAILIDAKTGRVLWAKNAVLPLAVASTTKIMTAILTLENANLNDIVTVSSRAANQPKVKMYLAEGETVNLKDLLYALMLQSSNDAAVAIAEHVGGSVENFCAQMTERAKELGAGDTVFETPNGLDKGNHHSTAYDMALITRHALTVDGFTEIINTPSVSVTSSRRTYEITNLNRFLHEYNGAIGVKTGFTSKAGHCFVGAAKRGDMQLISVVLASGWGTRGREQKWRDTKQILNYGFDFFEYKDIIKEGDLLGQVLVTRSKTETLPLRFAEGFQAITDGGETITITWEAAGQLKAPVKKGVWAGVAKIYADNQLLGEVKLLTAKQAQRHDFKTSCEKIFKAFADTTATK
ncbi:MAG: D-alanyl-D-alanine carboxypeptidase [Clostridiales bacterium]|jgi:D-alanyl-D-alanine carboxypeptidase (penicillin-binding protein 5/6)|nr:D-alanyl-D-alanine carboxypeptidase [Clostridiales bacterium]